MSCDVFNGLFNGLISHIEMSLKNKARLDKLWKTVKTSKKKFRQKLRMDKPCTSCISLIKPEDSTDRVIFVPLKKTYNIFVVFSTSFICLGSARTSFAFNFM